MAMHDDEQPLDAGTVRLLVRAQFPRWRELPVRRVTAAGTVNAIFRIGEHLAARFPLRASDPLHARTQRAAEAAAAAELAELASVPTPRPVAFGEPGAGYPLPWSVQTWLPGDVATDIDPVGSADFARDLAAFVLRLRGADTRGRRFAGDARGGHLPDHDEWIAYCFGQSTGLVDVARLRALWVQLRTLPEPDAHVMCHGDLIGPNILVRDGRLVGVLDGGGFGPADPALDLVAGWHLLDHDQRAVLRTSLTCGEVEWRRGAAWALQQAMGLVWYYAESNPAMSRQGRRTLARLLADLPS